MRVLRPLLCPALFQWLKQIEGTEAALTQKMLDLEKEKVSARSREEAAGRAQVTPTALAPGSPACVFVTYSHAFLLLLPWCLSG